MVEPAKPVDTTVAEAYEQFMVPGLFGTWVDDVVALAAPQPGEHVLDVACGTGTATRLVAERVTASGTVIGLDIDPGMIEVARSRPTSSGGASLVWHCGNALDMPFEDRMFDVVLCLQGVQFFPDKVAGLREIRRVLNAAGRLAASVWRTIEHCKGHDVLAQASERHGIDAGAALRPFSLGDADELHRLTREAGFRDVNIRAVVKPARFTSRQHFLESLAAGAPLTRHALAKVPEQERSALIEEVSAALQPYVDTDGVAIPYASHLLLARP
jgi:SAM-dependent methyltransferase